MRGLFLLAAAKVCDRTIRQPCHGLDDSSTPLRRLAFRLAVGLKIAPVAQLLGDRVRMEPLTYASTLAHVRLRFTLTPDSREIDCRVTPSKHTSLMELVLLHFISDVCVDVPTIPALQSWLIDIMKMLSSCIIECDEIRRWISEEEQVCG